MFKVKEAEDGTMYLYNTLTGALAGIVNSVQKERNGWNDQRHVAVPASQILQQKEKETVKDNSLSRSPRKSSLCIDDFATRNRAPYQRSESRTEFTTVRETRSRFCAEQQGQDCPCKAFQSEPDEDCLEKETFFGLFGLKPVQAPPPARKRNPACFCGRDNPPGVDMADLKTHYNLMEFSSALGTWSLNKLKDKFHNAYDPCPPTAINFLRYERCCQATGELYGKLHILRGHDATCEFPVTYTDWDWEEGEDYSHTYQFNRRQRMERRMTLRTGLNKRSRELRKNLKGLSVRLARMTEAEIKSHTQKRAVEVVTIDDESSNSGAEIKETDGLVRVDNGDSGNCRADGDEEGHVVCAEKESRKVWNLRRSGSDSVPDPDTPVPVVEVTPKKEVRVTELARRCSIPLDDISDRFQDANVEDNVEPAPGEVGQQSVPVCELSQKAQQEKEDLGTLRHQPQRKPRRGLVFSKKTVENGGGSGDYLQKEVTDDIKKATVEREDTVKERTLRKGFLRSRDTVTVRADDVENCRSDGDYLKSEKAQITVDCPSEEGSGTDGKGRKGVKSASISPPSPSPSSTSTTSSFSSSSRHVEVECSHSARTRSFNLRSGSSRNTGNNGEISPYGKMVNKYAACADGRTFTPRKYIYAKTTSPKSPGNCAQMVVTDACVTPKKVASPHREGASGKWLAERPATRARSNGHSAAVVTVNPEVVINGKYDKKSPVTSSCKAAEEGTVSREEVRCVGLSTRSGAQRKRLLTAQESGDKKTWEKTKCRFIFKCRGCGIEKTYLSKGPEEAMEIVSSHVTAVHKEDKVSLNNCEKRFGDKVTTVAELTVKRKPGSRGPLRKSLRVLENRHR